MTEQEEKRYLLCNVFVGAGEEARVEPATGIPLTLEEVVDLAASESGLRDTITVYVLTFDEMMDMVCDVDYWEIAGPGCDLYVAMELEGLT